MEPWGGLIETPNINRLAANGLTYTNWHTTALCSPTRSSLLTGRNHTTNGMACIAEATSGFPNANGHIPFECATIAEVLGDRGWNTYMLGQVAPVSGRRDEPGVDKAELAGRAGLRALLRIPGRRDEPVVSRPRLRQPPGGTAQLARGRLPPDDRSDRQGDRVRQGRRRSIAPEKPFFMYFCPGATPRAAPRARRSGSRSTRASSTWVTRRIASSCSSGRSRWGSSRSMPSSRR